MSHTLGITKLLLENNLMTIEVEIFIGFYFTKETTYFGLQWLP